MLSFVAIARICEDQYFFKRSTFEPAKSSEIAVKSRPKLESRLGSTVERIVLKTSADEQIIKEETSTILPKGQSMSWEDLKSGASITRDTQGNYVLKEVEYKTIKFPCSAEEEDDEGDRVSRRRRGPGRGSGSEGE